MSGSTYSSPGKYMVKGSQKAFQESIHSETHQYQSQISKIMLASEEYEKSVIKSRQLETMILKSNYYAIS